MRKTKELFIYGIALFALAVIDMLTFILDIRAGLFDMIGSEDTLEQKVTNIIIYVMAGWCIISILINAYLGIKGIAESKNASGGRLHIFIAKFIGIVNLIFAIILGIGLLDSTDLLSDLETFGLCVVDMILMFSYASAAKAVKNGAP